MNHEYPVTSQSNMIKLYEVTVFIDTVHLEMVRLPVGIIAGVRIPVNRQDIVFKQRHSLLQSAVARSDMQRGQGRALAAHYQNTTQQSGQ